MVNKGIISESTAVSLGVLAVLVGGIFWLSSLYSLASNSDIRLTKVEQKHDLIVEDIHQIKEDLAVIKEILKKDKN